MAGKIITLFILLNNFVSPAVVSLQDYWALRADFLRKEEIKLIGGDLEFERGESTANTILMTYKQEEIAEAFKDINKFLPAKNFIEAIGGIEKSKIFEIIKKMPKGADLHLHDVTVVDADWLYNVTFRENLYICDDHGQLFPKFFQTPSSDCDWKLLSELRKDSAVAEAINERIRKKISMVVENPDKMYPNGQAAWFKFKETFDFITPLLMYRPVFEDNYYEGLKELYEDNVSYLELRVTLPVLYELDGTTYSPGEVAGIYQNVTKRFIENHPDFLGTKIIYSALRSMNTTQAQHFVDEAIGLKRNYPNFFIGIDIADEEDRGPPLKTFVDILIPIKDEIDFYFHAAETNWYGTSSDENLIDAVLLNTKRIGHGYAVAKHPEVLDYVKKNRIAIEVSPISNQVLGLVKDLRNHPASVLFTEGVPVVISNDNPTLWGSRGLSYDFYEAFMGIMSGKADIRALKQLAMNSIIYSGLSQDEKKLMNNDQRKRTLIDVTSDVIVDIYYLECPGQILHPDHPQGFNFVIFLLKKLAFHKLNHLGIEILQFAFVLMQLLRWPCLDAFFEALKDSWKHPSYFDYNPILGKLLYSVEGSFSIIGATSPLSEILDEVWENLIHHNIECIAMGNILLAWWVMKDITRLECVINDSSTKQYRKCILGFFIRYIAHDNIAHQLDLVLFDKFIAKVFMSEEEREQFRADVACEMKKIAAKKEDESSA